MTVNLLPENPLEFLSLKVGYKCHIVGNLMLGLNNSRTFHGLLNDSLKDFKD